MKRVEPCNGMRHTHQIKSLLCLIDFDLNRRFLRNGLFVLISASFANLFLCSLIMPQNL
jgi:hypothetical protein